MSDFDWWNDEPFGDDDDEPAQLPFNPGELDDLLNDLGYDNSQGVYVDFSNVEVDKLQGARFDNLQDAIYYLYDAGILSFFGVTYIEDDRAYAVFENYP